MLKQANARCMIDELVSAQSLGNVKNIACIVKIFGCLTIDLYLQKTVLHVLQNLH